MAGTCMLLMRRSKSRCEAAAFSALVRSKSLRTLAYTAFTAIFTHAIPPHPPPHTFNHIPTPTHAHMHTTYHAYYRLPYVSDESYPKHSSGQPPHPHLLFQLRPHTRRHAGRVEHRCLLSTPGARPHERLVRCQGNFVSAELRCLSAKNIVSKKRSQRMTEDMGHRCVFTTSSKKQNPSAHQT